MCNFSPITLYKPIEKKLIIDFKIFYFFFENRTHFLHTSAAQWVNPSAKQNPDRSHFYV